MGAIIMIITTLKSVGERTREIGVLKAIGWSNKRVMGLILVESFIQFILAGILALILWFIILLYVNSTVPDLNSINYLNENMMFFGYILGVSFVFSILMPVLGCLIPLVRVARLKPTEALKYE
jgi:putative ABC transport system permease protein